MYWEKIGVKANLRLSEYSTYRPILSAREVTDVIGTHGVPRNAVEPYAIFNSFFNPKTHRYFGAGFPELGDLHDKVLAEPNFEKRAELQKQWGQIMIDNAWIIPIANRSKVWAYGPKVAEWEPMPVVSFMRNAEYATRAK